MSTVNCARNVCAAAVITATTWAAIPVPARASNPGRCLALVVYHGGPTAWYRPSQVQTAERLFGLMPVGPVAAVRQAVPSLKFSQVLLTRSGPFRTVTRAEAITYVFRVPEPACTTTPGCRRGPYVTVEEAIGHVAISGLFVSNDPNDVPGPWHARGNLPRRQLVLSADTNLPRSAMLEIARLIVNKARVTAQ